MGAQSERDLGARIVRAAVRATDLDTIVATVAEWLVAEGFAPGRVNLAVITHHPSLSGVGYTWSREDRVVRKQERAWGFLETAEHRESPLHVVMTTRAPLRIRIGRPSERTRFTIAETFARAGATDYIALPIPTARGDVHVLSIWTDRRGGFSAPQLRRLYDAEESLSLAVEVFEGRRLSRTIVDTYLGPRTGARVLAGQIHRGDSERIRAAIWFSDIRGFTAMTSRFGDERIVRALDDWFDLAVGKVNANGGEVLKLMGDAVLAIFPVTGDDPRPAAEAALDAAHALREAETRRSVGNPLPMQSGVALHTGEVLYGNIGAPGRLDFTVIGTAVNAAARMTALCRPLDEPILVSQPFAEATRRPFRACGLHPLRGLGDPVALFAPSDVSRLD